MLVVVHHTQTKKEKFREVSVIPAKEGPEPLALQAVCEIQAG